VLNSLLQSAHVLVLEKALSAASLRHNVISNNIANVNTPGFKKSDVSFEDKLQLAMNAKSSSMARTHERHLPMRARLSDEPSISTSATTVLRGDGNNVDIDSEMAALAKNSIYYDAVAQQIGKYFATIKSVIKEGR